MLRIASQTLSTTLAILGLAACADSPPRPDLFAPAALTASASAPGQWQCGSTGPIHRRHRTRRF